MNSFLKPYEEKMNSTISVYKDDLKSVRAGRANPAILDKIKVEYYGQETPINQIAGISVPEARMIVIQPWDTKILEDIEKAILKADIGLNPNNDGKVIRLVIPALTEERRKALSKDVSAMGEESKIAIRNIRRDAMTEIKKLESNGEYTEDERKRIEEDIQKLTDKFTDEIDSITKKKESEIMEI